MSKPVVHKRFEDEGLGPWAPCQPERVYSRIYGDNRPACLWPLGTKLNRSWLQVTCKDCLGWRQRELRKAETARKAKADAAFEKWEEREKNQEARGFGRLSKEESEEEMTIEECKRRIKEIEDQRLDDERAHSMEDQLHEDVLLAVAAGHPDSKELAALALTTADIDFARWCA